MRTLRFPVGPLAVTTAVAASLAVLVSCGGDGTTAPSPPTEEPAPVLDFAPIAGEWTGSATENIGFVFFMDATLASSAPRGEKVGDIVYRLTADGPPDCTGRWLAHESDEPVFVVLERIGGNCPPGTVRLTLANDGSLAYVYTPDNGNQDIAASGTLTRK